MFKISLIIALFFGGYFFGQNILTGNITSESGIPLSNAQVILKSGERIVSFAATNADGQYQLSYPLQGNFTLIITALNYLKQEVPIKADAFPAKKDFVLVRKETQIQEVKITMPKRVLVKQDTVVLDVKSFSNKSEKSIGDVLKKMPGVEIDADGKIKVQGKEIEKIMIEGDDFLERGYKIISNNFPVNPVSKVEIIHNYSNNSLLKGIENTDKVALNLKLHEDAKNVWIYDFDLESAIAPEQRYDLTGNVYSLGKRNKYFFSGNANSFNRDLTEKIEAALGTSTPQEAGVIDDNYVSSGLLKIIKPELDFRQERKYFSTTFFTSANAILNPNPKLKIKFSNILKAARNDYNKKIIEKISAGSLEIENQSISEMVSRQNLLLSSITTEYKYNPNAELLTQTKLSLNTQDDQNSLLFNVMPTEESLQARLRNINQSIKFTKKIDERSALVVGSNVRHENSNELLNAERFFFEEEFPNQLFEGTYQQVKSRLNYAGVTAQYVHKSPKGNSLSITANQHILNNYLHSGLFGNEAAEEDVILSANDMYYDKMHSEAKAQYIQRLKNISVIYGLSLNYLHQNLKSYENKSAASSFFINPTLGFSYQYQHHKASLIFTSQIQTPNAEYLLPNKVNTSLRVLYQGLGQIENQKISSFLLSYNYGDWASQFMVSSFLQYNLFDKSFANGVAVSQMALQNSLFTASLNDEKQAGITMDYYIKKLKTGVKLKNTLSQQYYFNRVNDLGIQRVDNSSFNSLLQFTSAFAGNFNYSIGIKYQRNMVTSDTYKNNFNRIITSADLLYSFNKNTRLNIIAERYDFKGKNRPHNSFHFIDAKFEFQFAGQPFSINGYNLLNTNRYQDVKLFAYYATYNTYRLPQRFFTLGTSFDF